MAKPSTTPKEKSPPKSRAPYFRERRSKKKILAEARHWSLDLLDRTREWLDPILGRWLAAYEARTLAWGAEAFGDMPRHPAGGEPLSLEAMRAPAAPWPTGAPETVPAPAGGAALVIGKYPDDPTGHSTEPIFTDATQAGLELKDACQIYFREHHADELERIREYQNFEDAGLSNQMVRAMFARLSLPVPADDPDRSKELYIDGVPF